VFKLHKTYPTNKDTIELKRKKFEYSQDKIKKIEQICYVMAIGLIFYLWYKNQLPS